MTITGPERGGRAAALLQNRDLGSLDNFRNVALAASFVAIVSVGRPS